MSRRCRRGAAPSGIGAALIALALVLSACGGGSGSESGGKGGSSTTTTKARDTTTTGAKDAGSGPFCAKFAALQAERGQLIGQKGSAQAQYELALRGLKELDAVATAQVKDALRTTIAAYERVGPALAAVGYDGSKLTAEQRAPLESSEVSAANQTLSTYADTNCAPARTTTTGG